VQVRAQILKRPAPAGARPLSAVELPDPEPGVGELVLRVAACGGWRRAASAASTCSSVKATCRRGRLPVIPGHQAVGTVEAVGAGVTGWRTGDRAGAAWLAGACGDCARCRRGKENLCASVEFTGWDRDGGYAERIAVRAGFALRLPEAFDDMAAAPLLCGGIIGYRALRMCGIEPGGRLGLYGFGASALLAIQVGRHWGCEVYVATRSREDRRRPLDRGAIMAPAMTSEPFVGRQQELERLCGAFDGACEGRGGLVMITGEPGIGKTRLARELESYAVEHGARVLWGRAHEAGGAPAYWPWAQALG
jgi:propanol-preferring alcohol dehydrogenase